MDSDPTQVYQQALNAARQGDTTHLAAALTSGLDNNLTDHKGDTLLMLAAYHSHLETMQLLLQNGADPNQVNTKGQHPLTGASYKGQPAIVSALLAHGADPEGGAKPNSPSPLMYAAMYNHVQVLRALLEAGADPNRRTTGGDDALSLARRMDAVYCIEVLESLRSD